VGEHSGPIPEEIKSKLGEIICNLARWLQQNQRWVPFLAREIKGLGSING
jgi:hypothetical protein